MGKLEIQAGADGNGAGDQNAIALAWRSGGYRHFIRSRHFTASNDLGNGIDFFLNASGTPGGSSAPGVGNTHVLTMAGNGNVGIGVTNPASRLVVQGDAGPNTYQLVVQSASNPGKQLLMSYQTAGNYGAIQPIEQGVDFRNLALNPSGGNVGIGTTTPTQGRLQIAGGPNRTSSGLTTYWAQQGVRAWAGGTDPGGLTSIYTDGFIVGLGFVSHSDERIKRVAGHSDAAHDLRTLLGIEVTDYSYVDTVAKGSGLHKKVLAQQVEKVFPQAVSRSTDVVPDIYEKAAIKDGWVKLATNLKKGERVRLIGMKQEGIFEVLEVAEGRFRTDFAPEGDQVLVYGREVKDFRSVDYEAIAMLNVSATQELARRLESQTREMNELRAELEKLRNERKSLAQSVSALTARDQAWEARFARLELKLQAAPADSTAKANAQTEEQTRESSSLTK